METSEEGERELNLNCNIGPDSDSILMSLKVKVEEQNELISLMQAQIDVQTEKLQKQEQLIQELTLQVKELQLKEEQRKDIEKKTLEPKEKGPTETNSSSNNWTNGETLPQNATLADIVKEAAEQTLTQSGFVYDENSKLYYDYSSGYYYDPVQSLYYNGHTRTYYSYDDTTKQYTFHSQLSPLPTPNSSTEEVQFLKKTKRKKSKSLDPTKDSKKKTVHLKTEANGCDVTSNKKESSSLKPKKNPVVLVQEKETVKPVKLKLPKKVKVDDEIEDGEISSSSDSDSNTDPPDHVASATSNVVVDLEKETLVEISSDSSSESDDSVREVEPAPCIRAIVTESTLPELTKGFLFLITCTGGTIGREGSAHAVLLEDTNVSKCHAMIKYGIEESQVDECVSDSENVQGNSKHPKYMIRDLGSQNGTFLNGLRLSESKVPSKLNEIPHGSMLTIGDTTLLLHIHPGVRTCGHCEPGLIMVKKPLYGPIQSIGEKEAVRKKELKKLRRKYGLEPQNLTIPPKLPHSYQDRAKERRAVLGSDNPFEKTKVASVDESIQPDNKGFKMMAKMGWTVGKTLGQTEDSGIHEPIKIKFKQGRGGLGADEELPYEPPEITPLRKPKASGHSRISKSQQLKKTRKRFQACSSSSTSTPGPSSDFPEEYTID